MKRKLFIVKVLVTLTTLTTACSENSKSSNGKTTDLRSQRVVLSGSISQQFDGCGTVLCDKNKSICATISTDQPVAMIYPTWPQNIPEGTQVTYEGLLSLRQLYPNEGDVCMGMIDYHLLVTDEY
jgi:hypothetical protein